MASMSFIPTHCFNEAEALKPRIPNRRKPENHGNPGRFNEAEALKPRILVPLDGAVWLYDRFNEAEALKPRIPTRQSASVRRASGLQ